MSGSVVETWSSTIEMEPWRDSVTLPFVEKRVDCRRYFIHA